MPIDARASFDAVVRAVDRVRARPEITVSPAPGPARLAPFTLALTASVHIGGEEIADGRLVVLHDPDGQESWQGTWRVVMFASAELDPGMSEDPVLLEMGWTWLQEALGERDLAIAAFGGTVTRTTSQSFGSLAGRPATGEIEIRSSWTPAVSAPHPGLRGAGAEAVIPAHVAAWLDLLALITSLEAPAEGVSRLGRA